MLWHQNRAVRCDADVVDATSPLNWSNQMLHVGFLRRAPPPPSREGKKMTRRLVWPTPGAVPVN